MRLTKIVAVTSSLLVTAASPRTAQAWDDSANSAAAASSYDHPRAPLFSANELSVDLSGTYFTPERGLEHLFETSIKGRRGTWGGDVGINYFFTREIGVGADAIMSDNGGNFVDAVLGDLIFRLPIGDSGFAPYVFGGGGRTTDGIWQWVGQGGLGLEYRFTHRIGIFTDGRYLWPQHSPDALLLRAGIRIAF